MEQADGQITLEPENPSDRSIASRLPQQTVKAASNISNADATIVLATHSLGRWPHLVSAVESIMVDENKPGHVVICVDRNEELYARIQETWPHITTVANTGGRGASGARNTGAQFAKTPFIIFIDDDIKVTNGWTSRLLEPFADPTVVGTGGGVVPRWQASRPGWFPEEFNWVIGASYRGMPTSVSTVRNVWAENMAVRTGVFHAVGGFRAGFGKVGELSRPEDTDLCIRMATDAVGKRWVYVPNAIAEHHVPEDRATISFFLRRTYHEGCGKVEMAQLLGRQEKLQDERDYLRITLPAGILRSSKAALVKRDLKELLKAAAIVAGIASAAAGALIGTLRKRRSREPL